MLTGMVEHMAMFPVDTLKTRMQMIAAVPYGAASPPLHLADSSPQSSDPRDQWASTVESTPWASVLSRPKSCTSRSTSSASRVSEGTGRATTRLPEWWRRRAYADGRGEAAAAAAVEPVRRHQGLRREDVEGIRAF
ncbi:hypothetical protein Acr_18g0008460 [Actinidia rufa]|uniref:Uncharacterized protein n=1 Tax=Actinidia rufa TaxID=165716 RepID=A0A7J0G7B1_9ERIC|nr:hypothetical protein Acr_18g0008460 [Actinidia rufa]